MAFNPSLSTPGIVGKIKQGIEGSLEQGWATKLGMLFNSNSPSEIYRWLDEVPQVREFVSGRMVEKLRSLGMTIVNKHWENSIEIPVADRRRDKTGQVQTKISELVKSWQEFWEDLLKIFIANGESGAAYDGSAFFATDHDGGDAGDQSNLITASDVAKLAVVDSSNPTEAEMARAISATITYMRTLRSRRGRYLNGQANSFVVVCGNGDLHEAALAATTNPQVLDSSGKGVANTLPRNGNTVEALFLPELSDWDTDFAVFRADGSFKPFILQKETDVAVKAIAEGSELEFNEDVHRFGGDQWCNVGYGCPTAAVKATLEDA